MLTRDKTLETEAKTGHETSLVIIQDDLRYPAH